MIFFQHKQKTYLASKSTYHIVLIVFSHLEPLLGLLISLNKDKPLEKVFTWMAQWVIFKKTCISCVVIPMAPTFLSVLSAMLRVFSLSFCLTRAANASLSSMSCSRSLSSFSHSSSSSSSFLTDCPESPLIIKKIHYNSPYLV